MRHLFSMAEGDSCSVTVMAAILFCQFPQATVHKHPFYHLQFQVDSAIAFMYIFFNFFFLFISSPNIAFWFLFLVYSVIWFPFIQNSLMNMICLFLMTVDQSQKKRVYDVFVCISLSLSYFFCVFDILYTAHRVY